MSLPTVGVAEGFESLKPPLWCIRDAAGHQTAVSRGLHYLDGSAAASTCCREFDFPNPGAIGEPMFREVHLRPATGISARARQENGTADLYVEQD